MNNSIRRNLMSVSASDGIIDLSLRDVHGNPIKRSTANCYVIKEPGQYKFPLVYGNGIKNGKVNNAAFTNNGDANSCDFVDGAGLIITNPIINDFWIPIILNSDLDNTTAVLDFLESESIIYPGEDGLNYICIDVKSVPGNGANIIISIRDSYDDFNIWNWHIWLWPYDLTPVEITKSSGYKYKIMPVNLATILDTADSINKTTGWKNWFYQFGRPTPLLCPGAYNSNSMPPVGNCIKSSAATNIEDGINKPSYFFQSSSSFYDNWFTYESEKTRNLWDTAGHYRSSNMLESKVVKSVYDPCPVGWKIPSINMLSDFTKNNSYTIGSFTNGWKFKRYLGDTVGVFFPASGRMTYTTGSYSNVGEYCSIWYSKYYTNYDNYLYLFTTTTFSPTTTDSRAYGCSVRPVLDYDTEDETIVKDFVITDSKGNEIILQYEVGMTWFEWICSEYNNVEIDGGLIGIDSDGYININENWIVHTNIDASVDYGVYLGEEIGVFDYQLYEY